MLDEIIYRTVDEYFVQDAPVSSQPPAESQYARS
jgi:hypothetical protein